jgi:hypothetical protein
VDPGQDTGAHDPPPLHALPFIGTVQVTQNSSDGITINGTAGQAFSGKLATLPGSDLPSLSGTQTSPVTVLYSPTSASRVQVIVSWGDGTEDQATLVQNSDGDWDVMGNHTYADAGTYRITVRATSQAAQAPGAPDVFLPLVIISLQTTLDTALIGPTPPGFSAYRGSVFVSGVPSITSGPGRIGVGGMPGQPLGTLHLASGMTVANTVLTIDWGDGTTSKATLTANASGGYDINGAHTYTRDGNFAIEITRTFGFPGPDFALFQTIAVTEPPIMTVLF